MIRSLKRFLCTMVLFQLWLYPASGQDLSAMIKGFNPANTSYSYEIVVMNERDKSIIDKTSGSMYVFKNKYLDSNSIQINAYDGRQSLQLIPQKKKGYLKSFKKLDKEDNAPQTGFDLKALLKEGISKVTSAKASNGDVTITIKFDGVSEELRITIDQRQFLKQLVLKTTTLQGQDLRLSSILVMKNFKEDFNKELLSLNRFFENKDRKKLAGPYAQYELRHIIL